MKVVVGQGPSRWAREKAGLYFVHSCIFKPALPSLLTLPEFWPHCGH